MFCNVMCSDFEVSGVLDTSVQKVFVVRSIDDGPHDRAIYEESEA